jgi:hypothetical protein
MYILFFLLGVFLLGLLFSALMKKTENNGSSDSSTPSKTYTSPKFSLYEDRTEEVHGVECIVINFAVKGLVYRSKKAQNEARLLSVGDYLTMKPEPSNPIDPNAIKVYIDGGCHIGYVDADRALFVKENLPKLEKFVVSKVDDYVDPPYIYAEASFKKE